MHGLLLVTPELSEQEGFLMSPASSKPEHFLRLPPHKVETQMFRCLIQFDEIA